VERSSTSRRPARLIAGDGLAQDHLSSEKFDEQGSHGMYAHILLSTDGSDVARKGLEHGFALAKALNAKVTVITVTEPLPITVTEPLSMVEPLSINFGSGHAGGWSAEEVDRFDAASEERAGKVLDEAQAMAEHIGISAELLHIPNAHPASAMIETAKSRGCDLIVMGSHGRRGLRKLFLGSQTSEVLADASVPVLVVHA
jgi:nucleotide-binding universal stress UspA family protein